MNSNRSSYLLSVTVFCGLLFFAPFLSAQVIYIEEIESLTQDPGDLETSTMFDDQLVDIAVYPNPSPGQFMVTADAGVYLFEYALYSLDGRLIARQTLGEGCEKVAFDLRQHPGGQVILIMTTSVGVMQKRLFVL
ncbi:MAG: T9SS type A sorting domain-containing protein [Bacteroidia bacterium]|nr:T9SS type A sorting domain-containing protein [Bacteroidia bacterium]